MALYRIFQPGDFIIAQEDILQTSCHISFISGKIKQAVTAEVHDNHLFLTLFFCKARLCDRLGKGVCGFRRRDKALLKKQSPLNSQRAQVSGLMYRSQAAHLRAHYPGQHQFIPAARLTAAKLFLMFSLISVFCMALIKRTGAPLSSKNYRHSGSKMAG